MDPRARGIGPSRGLLSVSDRSVLEIIAVMRIVRFSASGGPDSSMGPDGNADSPERILNPRAGRSLMNALPKFSLETSKSGESSHSQSRPIVHPVLRRLRTSPLSARWASFPGHVRSSRGAVSVRAASRPGPRRSNGESSIRDGTLRVGTRSMLGIRIASRAGERDLMRIQSCLLGGLLLGGWGFLEVPGAWSQESPPPGARAA